MTEYGCKSLSHLNKTEYLHVSLLTVKRFLPRIHKKESSFQFSGLSRAAYEMSDVISQSIHKTGY